MSHNGAQSFLILPIELTFRILDYLDPLDIMISACNVCVYLDKVINIYHRYQVK